MYELGKLLTFHNFPLAFFQNNWPYAYAKLSRVKAEKNQQTVCSCKYEHQVKSMSYMTISKHIDWFYSYYHTVVSESLTQCSKCLHHTSLFAKSSQKTKQWERERNCEVEQYSTWTYRQLWTSRLVWPPDSHHQLQQPVQRRSQLEKGTSFQKVTTNCKKKLTTPSLLIQVP